jgi:hypothetical protein
MEPTGTHARRYLVVANQTLGGAHLLEKVRQCMAAGPSRFHIVVPATHPREHASWEEGEAKELASKRLSAAMDRFRELGAEVDGEIGAPSPVEAIGDAIRAAGRFDEIILSTLPPGPSRWLRLDLPHRVERAYNLPVTHLVADPQPA